MLLAMVLRAGRARGPHARVDPLLLATAILGLVWNLCALPSYELPRVGILGPFPLLVALGFSALGFLPAVVVHSVLRGERDGVRGAPKRALAAVAYARQRDGGGAALRRRHRRIARAIAARHAPAHLHVRGARRSSGRGDTRPAGIAARAVGRRARHLRGLGAAPESVSSGRRLVAGRARRPPRLAAAGLRHPLPGLPVRARGSVPQARPGAPGDRQHRVRGDRHVRPAIAGVRAFRAARPATDRRPRHVLGRDRAPLPRRSPKRPRGSSTPSSSPAPITDRSRRR